MFTLIILDIFFIFISRNNFAINATFNVFYLCTTISSIISRFFRLFTTRTNNYFITSFILLFLFLIGIVINSLVYVCIIFSRVLSNFYWIFYFIFTSLSRRRFFASFSLRSTPWYISISVYNSGRPPIKYKEVPNNTLAAPILSLRILNLCLTAVTIRFLIALSSFQF